MFNELLSKVSEINVNQDNIAQILIIASILVAVIIKIYIKLKEALVKVFSVIAVIAIIACCIAVEQGVLGDMVTKLTTFVK